MANEFVQRIVDNNVVATAITRYLPIGSQTSNTGFRTFNCPMCPDTKGRGGVKIDNTDVGVFCFKCGFQTRYEAGGLLSFKLRMFLSALGAPQHEIDQLNFKVRELNYILGKTTAQPVDHTFIPNFSERPLPDECLYLSEWLARGRDDSGFLRVAEYALSRGEEIFSQTMWTPDRQWRSRLIIPFKFKNNIVGWSGRLVGSDSSSIPRYINELQSDYLLNCDLMSNRERAFILMVEGALDALAIDGISPLGAKLSKKQANWINSMGKHVIAVADRDAAGSRHVDIALENGWSVAFPRISVGGKQWWQQDCKDAADAVKRYGRLYTLRSIIETATNNKLQIEMNRKNMAIKG